MSVITDIVVAVHLRVEGNVKNHWDEAAWQQPVLNRFFWRYFNGGGFRVLTPLPRMCEARLFRTLLLLFLIHNTYEMHVKPSLEKAQCDRLLKKCFFSDQWSVDHICVGLAFCYTLSTHGVTQLIPRYTQHKLKFKCIFPSVKNLLSLMNMGVTS